MKPMIVSIWTCHRARRRLQRYLDADSAAPLTLAEVHRLEEHLATCERCGEVEREYRGLSRALQGWAATRRPDPAIVARVRLASERIVSEDAS